MSATVALTHKDILQADRDYEMAATLAHLVYVNDRMPGITRKKKGKGFCYYYRDRLLMDKDELRRIRVLVIPPAWAKVWICAAANGHIQATGIDARGRKQYRYHGLWSSVRSETKFHRLFEFGRALPDIRQRVDADLRSRGLTREKVLATVLSLMERTYIRVGNDEYEKLYGSYGLTTMKNKHVTIHGDKMVFSFVGKKGVHHDITLLNKRLAKAVGQCREIPGRELFQYYEADGTRRSIDSGMVNQYIREASGGLDFTAKDFRTWAGSLCALREFRRMAKDDALNGTKGAIVAMLDVVSRQLGNSRAVCRKYYVHPGIISLYEEGKLAEYFGEATEKEEEVLMTIMKGLVKKTAGH
jgi:DNA topoisomerase I